VNKYIFSRSVGLIHKIWIKSRPKSIKSEKDLLRKTKGGLDVIIIIVVVVIFNYYYFMHVHMYLVGRELEGDTSGHVILCLWRSEDKFSELALSFAIVPWVLGIELGTPDFVSESSTHQAPEFYKFFKETM
jgi:hypothetical protein